MIRVPLRPLAAACLVALGLVACSDGVGPGNGNTGDPPTIVPGAVIDARTATALRQEPTTAAEPVDMTPQATVSRGTVTGHVTDTSGAPVADVGVTVREGTAPTPLMAVYSDAAGAYTWHLPTGTFTMQASRDGYAPATAEVTVEAGGTATVDFVLEPN